MRSMERGRWQQGQAALPSAQPSRYSPMHTCDVWTSQDIWTHQDISRALVGTMVHAQAAAYSGNMHKRHAPAWMHCFWASAAITKPRMHVLPVNGSHIRITSRVLHGSALHCLITLTHDRAFLAERCCPGEGRLTRQKACPQPATTGCSRGSWHTPHMPPFRTSSSAPADASLADAVAASARCAAAALAPLVE